MMLAIAGLLLATGFAQEKAKDTKAKSYTFHGKVEAVTAKGLTVNGEEVKGWMGAMTMNYPLDKPDVLKTVKVGDQISATVFHTLILFSECSTQLLRGDPFQCQSAPISRVPLWDFGKGNPE